MFWRQCFVVVFGSFFLIANLSAAIAGGTTQEREKPLLEPVVQELSITIEDFSRDRVPFHSRATEDSTKPIAQVSRSGTATPGHLIEARAVSHGDRGRSSTPWAVIAKAAWDGRWQGTLSVPRGRYPYTFEVRLKAAPTVKQATSQTFLSGLLIAMHTQSDIASPALKTNWPWVDMAPEPILDDTLVQMFVLQGFKFEAAEQPDANLKRVEISNATPYSPGMAALANTFIDLMPDTPVAFIMHTVSATSPFEMANDDMYGRAWANDRKLHDFATRDGNIPGLHANYFSSAYKGIADKYGQAHAPIFTGHRIDGTRFDRAKHNPHRFGFNRTIRIDHTYVDLYDPTVTQTMILPIATIEDSLARDFLDNRHFAGMFVRGRFDLYNSSVNGRWTGKGNRLQDGKHANAHKEWGTPRRMRMWGLSMIKALGETSLDQPLLDIVEAAPNGDRRMVRIGSSAGPISTIRKQLGQAELDPSRYPSYGAVYGVYVNRRFVPAYIGDDVGNPAKEGWIYVPYNRVYRDGDRIGTLSIGFARPKPNAVPKGAARPLDYYRDDAILSKPVVPSSVHNVVGLHAIMPKASGGLFQYRDIAAGRWNGRPTAQSD